MIRDCYVVTSTRLGNKYDTRKKNRLYQMNEKRVKKYMFCVFEKFFASKPQMDVCLCRFSLTFSIVRVPVAYIHFCHFCWSAFFREKLISFHLSPKKSYANGICNVHIVIFCYRYKTTIACWTLIEFTKARMEKNICIFHSLSEKWIYQLNLYFSLSIYVWCLSSGLGKAFTQNAQCGCFSLPFF